MLHILLHCDGRCYAMEGRGEEGGGGEETVGETWGRKIKIMGNFY